MHNWRTSPLPPAVREFAAGPCRQAEPSPGQEALEWSWPPYAPVETDDEPFDTADWAPASVVWHPHVRVGRWTVVYRRAAC